MVRRHRTPRPKVKTKKKIKVYTLILIYVILLNITMTVTVLNLTSYGNLFIGSIFDCPAGKIIFDFQSNQAQTLLECSYPIPPFVQNASAFVFVVPFAFLFLLIIGFPERSLFFVISGLIIVITQQHLFNMFGIPLIVSSVIGVAIFLLGEVRLIDSLSKNYEHLFMGRSKPY